LRKQGWLGLQFYLLSLVRFCSRYIASDDYYTLIHYIEQNPIEAEFNDKGLEMLSKIEKQKWLQQIGSIA